MKKTKYTYEYWLKKNWYYHSFIAKFYQFVIPKNAKVLQVGCKTGHKLAAVSPSLGVGVDSCAENIATAQEKYPKYQFFVGSIKDCLIEEKFDYIILSSTIMEVYDIQELFESLHPFCTQRTRIVLDSYAILWESVLWILQKLGLRRPTPFKNWISLSDIQTILYLADFEVVTLGRSMLFPAYIPGFSWLVNNVIAHIPLINLLCLNQWIIARPKPIGYNPHDFSVSVIIPCRNEKGNVEPAIQRCPIMGKETEVIFVEGHSQDDTIKEIERVVTAYPTNNIRYFVQDGKGKGDAVRKGFHHAKGDIVMILDADLTMPPEELPKFFDALMQGKGEFINGSRLVYGMEDKAMRFLNLIANYLFGVGFSWVMGQRVKDTLCGTKVLFKKDYDAIVQNRAFFGEFDPFGDFDLLFGAAKQNLKIIDMPIHYKARSYGETQIRRFYHALFLVRMSWIGFVKFKINR